MTPTPRTPKTTQAVVESPSAAASRYQQLRSHLFELKLHAAAEALPAVLDHASAEGLSLTVALERLLSVEVDATAARKLAGRLRFACLPTPATLADFDVDAAAGIDRKLIDELGYLPLPGIGDQYFADRPAGHRQNPPVGRVGPGGRARRLPDLLHHRRGSGRPLPPCGHRRTLGHHHAVL
jgi:IstB-like ATP binding protein